MTFVAKFKINKPKALKASFKINEQSPIKAIFKADFRPSKVSQLENDLDFQSGEQVQEAIQAESEIINQKIDTEVNRLDDRIDDIDVDISGTINSITGDALINTIREDRAVQLQSKTFVFEQATPSTEWVINHNLNKRPSIDLTYYSGERFEAYREYVNNNQVIIRLENAATGYAYLN